MTPAEAERLEQWQHPVTGERVTLTFGEGVTRLERGGQVSEQGPPSFDEAEERRRVGEQFGGHWSPLSLHLLRQMAQAGAASDEERARRVEELGFPRQVWEELEAVGEGMGLPWLRAGQAPEGPTGYHSSLARFVDESIFLDEEDADHSLLWNPTPEMRERLGALIGEMVGVSPLPEDLPFHEEGRHLREQGFVRLTARRPDGSLWLPPTLEPHRPQLEASKRPVLRLAAEPEREPQPWESKVGGVPYRPRGAEWPHARGEDTRPLVFLAQINFGEVNSDGRALPDFPGRGLLQLFILNDDHYGADIGDKYPRTVLALQEKFRVVYWPEVTEDPEQLDRTGQAPRPAPVPFPMVEWNAAEERLQEPDSLDFDLPHDPGREVALTVLPDREPVSGADDTASALLGLNLDDWEDEEAQAVHSSLYDLAPGGHKLGGYPDFTQQDPRRPEDDLILLFQLDSDERLGLQWGDMGTANFFIRPGDLKAQDFSRVAYHWDCG